MDKTFVWLYFPILFTINLLQLTGGCGITAKVVMEDNSVRTARELQSLALKGGSVRSVEVWCTHTPNPYTIYHDDTPVFGPSNGRYRLTEFGKGHQGVYRCECGNGVGNHLSLLLIPGIDKDSFVGTAKKGDTVHLLCPLENMHLRLSSLYLVQWRQGVIDITGDRHSYEKLPNHTLVIRDFDENDTESSFYCYIRQIGSDALGGDYLVSGPRQLLMLEEPNPEILTDEGTVSCSATTPFNASYCLTITFAYGQQMDPICESHEVKIRTSRMISAIICDVTVYSNASVPQSSLQKTMERHYYRIQDLVAAERRPTYLLVQWKAPPSPYSGRYQLTYAPLGGMMQYTMVTAPAVTSYNITGLQPFTRYKVTVKASNVSGGELSEVFSTLPDATLPAGVEAPTVGVPLFAVGSSAVVDILIPPPAFPEFLSHLWVVCIRNILSTTRRTAPDIAFPDNSKFGTYDSAEDNVPYIASEFDAAGINFLYKFSVGNESEMNDFPDRYRNGPVIAEKNLYCFVRYFVSTKVMPMERKRRDAIPNRQYDVFQSTQYAVVNIASSPAAPPSSSDNSIVLGAILGVLAILLMSAVGLCIPIVACVYYRLRQSRKKIREGQHEIWEQLMMT